VTDRTLCFLLRGDPPAEVLLGYKKAGFGATKYAGFGGKVELGETWAQAAVREVEEEAGIRVDEADLGDVGLLIFVFPARPTWSMVVHVCVATVWQGEPAESAEMRPAWFGVRDLPLAQMWQDARHWLPQVLAGGRVRMRFVFAADNETVAEMRGEEQSAYASKMERNLSRTWRRRAKTDQTLA
jgi:8-oxo-dGTP diphosphatase